MHDSTPSSLFDPSRIRGGEADLDQVYPTGVRVGRTSYGLGLFSFAFIPKGTPIGRIYGEVIHDPEYHSDFCIDIGDDSVLEPATPFCYMNHSCDPNCSLMHYVEEDALDGTEIEGNVSAGEELEEDEEECLYSEDFEGGEEDVLEEDDEEDAPYAGEALSPGAEVWVETLRDILPGEELTIDYAWPAEKAARCLCGSPKCRGWIVDPEELKELQSRR